VGKVSNDRGEIEEGGFVSERGTDAWREQVIKVLFLEKKAPTTLKNFFLSRYLLGNWGKMGT